MTVGMVEVNPQIVSLVIAVIVMVGGIVARDRQLTRMVGDTEARVVKNTSESMAKLHERIDRVRTDYAQRSDLDRHIDRFDHSLSEIRSEIRSNAKDTTERLDKVLEAINRKTS